MVRGPLFKTLALVALAATSALALDPYTLPTQYTRTNWTTDSGLWANTVIDQDEMPDGFLLVTFESRLMRFDGDSFLPLNNAGAPAGVFRGTMVDHTGRVWASTQSGLYWHGPGGFTLVPGTKSFAGRQFQAPVETADGSVWLVGQPGSVGRWKAGRWSVIESGTEGLPGVAITLTIDARGGLWVAGRQGVARWMGSRFEPLGGDWPFADHRRVGLIQAGRDGAVWMVVSGVGLVRWREGTWKVWSSEGHGFGDLALDRQGTLWATVDGVGMWRIRGEERDILPIGEATDPNNHFKKTLVDRSGSLWIGTDWGLLRLSDSWALTYGKPEGMAQDDMSALAEDHEGGIWLGMREEGLARLFGGKITPLPKTLGAEGLRSITVGPDGSLWSSWGHSIVVRVRDGTSTKYQMPDETGAGSAAILATADGSVWLQNFSWGLTRLKDGQFDFPIPQMAPASRTIADLKEDGNGGLLIASQTGLLHWSGGRLFNEGGIQTSVRHIAGNPQGSLWLATAGRGLVRYQGGKASYLDSSRGVCEDSLYLVEEDPVKKLLWVDSDRGFFWLDRAEADAVADGKLAKLECHRLTAEFGLRGREANGETSSSAVRDSKGRLWLTSAMGAVVLPASPLPVPDAAFPAQLVRMTAEPGAVAVSPGGTVPARSRNLSFRYTAPELRYPGQLRFRYRLEGYSDWVDAGTRREAYFTGVPPGNYRFQVEARGVGSSRVVRGDWPFAVAPRWHETVWFRICVVALVLALGYAALRWRLRALEAANRELEERVANRTQALWQTVAEAETSARRAEEATVRAEQASRAKSAFLANMSHEIRTPMNGVLGLAELLSSTPLNEEQREMAELIQRSGNCLLDLLNLVLDLSKAEAGQIKLERIPFAPVEMLGDVKALLTASAGRKGIYLKLEVDPGVPAWVVGDPVRFRQILINLAGNAIKFTAEGGVTIRCKAVERPGTDGTGDWLLRIEVQDTGIGVDPSQIARLFEPFQQADSSTTRKHGGTGLGLSICKELAQLMGGQAWAESEPGQGSTFWFTARLGAAAVEEPAPIATVPSTPAQVKAGARILVVDDNFVNQRLAKGLLTKLGYEAEVATSGLEALDRCLSSDGEPYDAILMDCQMPELDGLETTQRLRAAEPSDRHTPVIALTAQVLAGDRERCLAAGMDDYLSKPLNLIRLQAALERWVSGTSPIKVTELSARDPSPINPAIR